MFLAFDIEIAKVIPPGVNWEEHYPLGISVAATLPEDGEVKLWYGQGQPNGRPWDKMPQAQVRVLVAYLEAKMYQEGYTILTWNGLGFDFRVLAEESGLHDACVRLALGRHIDPMWHFFCENGHTISLDAAAKGMGLEGKTEGMCGALAPQLWLDGEYEKVMDYVTQDVQLTLEVARRMQKAGCLFWVTNRGTTRLWTLSQRLLLSTNQAAMLPVPKPPRWIKDPWQREKFTAWTKEVQHVYE